MSYLETIGMDEAGRGALAGPVVAAALMHSSAIDKINDIQDSKSLSPKKRFLIFEAIKKSNTPFAIGISSSQKIDEINILQATFVAFKNALLELAKNNFLSLNTLKILIDGPYNANHLKVKVAEFHGIIGGDRKNKIIAAASIVAKCTRDIIMQKINTDQENQYEWAQNKGYGTKKHIDLIKHLGTSAHHRMSFCKKFIV